MTIGKKTLMALVVVGIFVCSAWHPLLARADRGDQFNRTVVVLDLSGSFTSRFEEAIEKMRSYLEAIAAHRDRRWEIPDEVYLIALDGQPEVIWRGTRPQLHALDVETLRALIQPRKRHAACTDVTAALNLAAWKLTRAPVPLGKHLLVFSDLVDDAPPAVRGTGHCQGGRRPSGPPTGIEWRQFSGVNMLAFWMDDRDVRLWEPVLAEAGVVVRFFDEAEARSAELVPPSRPAAPVSTEGDAQKLALLRSLGAYLGWGIVLVIALPILFVAGRRALSAYRQLRAGRHAPVQPQAPLGNRVA
jgi:hypothetical protein